MLDDLLLDRPLKTSHNYNYSFVTFECTKTIIFCLVSQLYLPTFSLTNYGGILQLRSLVTRNESNFKVACSNPVK